MKSLHLIIIAIAVVIGVGAMGVYKFVDTELLIASTDSSKVDHTVNIGVDGWAGYVILCSSEMRRISLENRILIKCHDDKANYPDRMAKLASGELQMAAAEVSGYILTGADINYQGKILFVIDESQGGDAILANKSVATNTNDVKKQTGLRIGFTPDSPSHTLMTKWSTDFDVKVDDPAVMKMVKTTGSADAAKKLRNGELDVAVLWEPDVSKALATGKFVKLLGTENTKNLIVDTLMANDRFAKSEPEVTSAVVSAYFRAQEFYKSNPDEFDDQIVKYTGIDRSQVNAVKAGINWIDLPHNGADWLGVNGSNRASRQLYDTINSVVKLFINVGEFKKSPIPSDDPFRLINSGAFTEVFNLGMAGKLAGLTFAPISHVKDVSVTRPFKRLSPGRWTRLNDVGSLKLEHIRFKTGTPDLEESQDSFDKLVEMLKTYPNYRIKIVGHTGRRGDKAANQILSKKRATTAAKHLMEEFGIDKNRFYAYGVGNEQPPHRVAGEKRRAYFARWPRVELILVGE